MKMIVRILALVLLVVMAKPVYQEITKEWQGYYDYDYGELTDFHKACPAQDVDHQPNASIPDEVVLGWAMKAAPESMKLSYGNIKQHLSEQQGNFTPNGFCKFLDALVRAKMYEAMASRKLSVTLVPKEKAQMAQSSSEGWLVKMPAVLNFETDDKNAPSPMPMTGMLSLTIKATGTPAVLSIDNWIFGPM